MAVAKPKLWRLTLSDETKSSLTSDNLSSSKSQSKRFTRRIKDNGKQGSTCCKDAFKGHGEFSLKGDLAIIKFLLKNSHYMKSDGREVWLKMSSQKHSWREMKDRYMKVIQPDIDKYPIETEDKKKLQSCPSGDKNGNGDLATQNISKRPEKDDYNWSHVKRCRSDVQHSSPEKERNLTSMSSPDDRQADVALKAEPSYRRLKFNSLQLKVIKLRNEKCNVGKKTVQQQCNKMSDKNEEFSETCRKEIKLDDLCLRVALLSDDLSSNESAEEQLKTKKGNKGRRNSSSRRSRRKKNSKKAESSEPDIRQDSSQTDTSVEMFPVEHTSRTSLPTQHSSRQLQPSKDKGKNSPNDASSDENHTPAALPLENAASNVLHTNCIKNFILSDSQYDSCFEVDSAEKTEDIVVRHSEETDEHLLVCEKLMTWLNVSPEVFAHSVLMNSGNVDDAVHWLLFSKTKTGDAVWDSKDDKDLLTGDEEIYKLLEEKYGETLIMKRQQFLALNSLPLRV